MLVYKLKINSEDCIVVQWHPTNESALEEAEDIPGSPSFEVEPMDIPTDQDGLLRWLNDNIVMEEKE